MIDNTVTPPLYVERNFQTIFVSRPREIPQYRERSGALQIGHMECLQFSVQLPQSSCLPPSYKGRVLRYAYFVAVCVTVRNAHSGATVRKVVRMPFRIHNPLACLSPIFSKFDKPFNFRWQFHQEHLQPCVQHDNDHHDEEQCEAMRKPSALDIIQQIKVQQKRKAMKHYSLHNVFADIERIIQSGTLVPKRFDICRGDNLVCRLSMFNTSFQIGDTIGCTFDFSNATIHCMEIRCSLVYEEILAEWLSKDTNLERSNDRHSAGADADHPGGKITRTSVAYFKEHVLHNMFTSFNLMIPPHAPAQFSTDLVKVKYFLRFTFKLLIDRKRDSMPSTMRKDLKYSSTSSTAPHLNVGSRPVKKSMEGISSTTQKVPPEITALDAEELEWSLPISVFVPNSFRPLHVQSHSREMYSSLM